MESRSFTASESSIDWVFALVLIAALGTLGVLVSAMQVALLEVGQPWGNARQSSLNRRASQEDGPQPCRDC